MSLFIRISLFLSFIGNFLNVNAQTDKQIRKVDRLFRKKGEIHFQFFLKKSGDVKQLTKVISIDHVRGDTVWAFANKKGMLDFYRLGYSKFQLLETSSERFKRESKKSTKGPASTQAFDTYPTLAQYEQAMQDFENQYPAICKLYNLGTLPSGKKILALKISDSLNVREAEPQFLYTSTMHGDETAGFPVMLKLTDYLLSGYGTNPRATNLINNIEIWINPLANPDGAYNGNLVSVANAKRSNNNNVDLNRNYPDPEDGPHPDGNAYQPETRIFMNFADSMDFVMAANFHGGVEVANYPWDTWQRRPADEAWWISESGRFADSIQAHAPANYFNELFGYPNIAGVVQGYDWYEVNGGRQDYMNWFHHCREFTVELSDVKILQANQLNNHWNYTRESLLNYMEASLYGIRGEITDACTGKPLKARVFVLGHDKDSSHVYSSAKRGNYHRPISPGTYEVLVSAPGYQSDTLHNVLVTNGVATLRNTTLQPNAPVAQFEFAKSDFCGSSVNFKDLSGSASQWTWSFGDASQGSTTQNPGHSYAQSGTFLVQLVASNCAGSDLINKSITVTANPSPFGLGDTSHCGSKVHHLQALSGNSVEWYSASSGGFLLDTGNAFASNPLSQTTTFYAESVLNSAPQNVGPQSNAIGTGGYFTANTYHYLSFDAASSFILKSVQVYAAAPGLRNIQLRDGGGLLITNITVNIPQGPSRVNLNFSVPSGYGFQLGIAGGNSCNLYRNQAGAVYPYEIDNVVSIVGNSASNSQYYYYFYDWEVVSQCRSPRVPVQALVLNALPVSVLATASSVAPCAGDSVIFTSSITNGGPTPIVRWFMNDLQIAEGPVYKAYGLPFGQFIITCKAISGDSCSVNNPATSNPLSITVLAKPLLPDVLQMGAYVVSSTPTGNQWFWDGNPVPGATNDSLLIVSSGAYSVQLTGVNGCKSDISSPIMINAVAENDLLSGWQAFFTSTGLAITNPSIKIERISVMNALGQTILNQEIKPGKSEIKIRPDSEGIYFLSLSGQEKVIRVMVGK